MKEPLTLEAHQSARMVVDPLRLFDCSLISDGVAVVLIARGDRARDLRQTPVRLVGMQGTRSGRDEFIFAPRSLGINQQLADAPRLGHSTSKCLRKPAGARGRARLLHL